MLFNLLNTDTVHLYLPITIPNTINIIFCPCLSSASSLIYILLLHLKTKLFASSLSDYRNLIIMKLPSVIKDQYSMKPYQKTPSNDRMDRPMPQDMFGLGIQIFKIESRK